VKRLLVREKSARPSPDQSGQGGQGGFVASLPRCIGVSPDNSDFVASAVGPTGRRFHTCACTIFGLGLAAAALLSAADAKKNAAPRPPLTEEERRAHLAPLAPADQPLVTPDTVFEEKGGAVVVEAEHFVRQSRDQIRRWYLNSAKHTPTTKPDPDPVMVTDASNGAYIVALPDTFVHQHERAIDGINIGLAPGAIAVVHYPVHFSQPGRYYIWTRMRSNDDEDNTLNLGLNDEWPASARCLQFPKLKKVWWWGGVIRDARGPSFPHHRAYLDVPSAGQHTVMFSMREDGFEFDKFMLTMDGTMKAPEGAGPAASPFKTGGLRK